MKKTIHTITIKLVTTKHVATDTIWARIAHAMRKDKLFTEEAFESIKITGKNNHE